jgi:hypothetical protein
MSALRINARVRWSGVPTIIEKLMSSVCRHFAASCLHTAQYAESKGCVQFKFVRVNNRGVPDRIIITPVGDVLFVEFKRKGKDLTALQKKHRAASHPKFS